MINSFVYNVPTRIYFGKDMLSAHLGEEMKRYGKKAMLVYNGQYVHDIGIYDTIRAEAEKANIEFVSFTDVQPNPRHSDVNKAVKICKEQKVDMVIGIGGGSAMDSAKMIATAACYTGDDCWDLISKKAEPTGSLPVLVIVTMAATGSETDCHAVITNEETNDKISLIYSEHLPKVAFLNPEYTFSTPKFHTAAGSVDIFNHALEAFFCPTGGLYAVDAEIEGLLRTVLKYAPIAYNEPQNYEARANLMWCAPWAINDFVRGEHNQKWSMHAIEHQLSAYHDITHGLGLAIVMPRWLRHIVSEKTMPKFRELGIEVFHLDPQMSDNEMAEAVIKEIEDFTFHKLHLASNLTDLGINDQHFEEMAAKMTEPNGYFNGYTKLYKDDILEILKQCL